MKPGTYIVAVVIAGFILIGYLFSTAPTTAANQLPLIIAAVAGLATLLAKQADTDTRVDAATQQSKDNNEKIAIVADKVDTNTAVTEETNKMADGRLSAALEKIDRLTQQVGRLETSAAVKASEASHAESSEARIIAAVSAAGSSVVVPAGVPTVEAPVVVVAPKATP